MSHAVDVALEFLVGVQGSPFDEILIAVGFSKQVFASVFGVFGRFHELGEHLLLQGWCFVEVAVEFPLSGFEYLADNAGQTHIVILFLFLLVGYTS